LTSRNLAIAAVLIYLDSFGTSPARVFWGPTLFRGKGGNVKQIRFAAPTSVDEAVGLLAEANGSARVLAGGTDLLVQLRSGARRPDLIIDIKKIDGLRSVTAENGGFRIGAAVAGAELKEHAEVPKVWPGVMEAFDLIGSTQIQGRASMGGNLCNGSPAADSIPAMIVAGATCQIVGPKGTREAKVEDIVIGPGKTSIADDEFVLSIFLPKREAGSGDAYLRFIPRTEMDIAVVGVGVNVTLDSSGVCTAARVALGAVAPTPLLVKACADALIGTKLDDDAMAKLAAAASAACNPINDKRGTIEYRTKVAGVIARRTAGIAMERARSN
jgi:CO/xanthine dehydrogenase FAD-binding subunit